MNTLNETITNNEIRLRVNSHKVPSTLKLDKVFNFNLKTKYEKQKI